jgi:hypothetical protein
MRSSAPFTKPDGSISTASPAVERTSKHYVETSCHIQHLLNMMLEDTERCKLVRKNVKRRGPGRPGKDSPHGALLLLKAGQSAFARHGFEGASLRGIAAAAGVDPALAAHHFGSKEALWEAVIERLALYLAPYIAELRELQTHGEIPIRTRIETAFRQLISSVCEEPEGGMLISRISAERGAKLDMLVSNARGTHRRATY